MRTARLNALDVATKNGDVFSLIKEGDFIHLVRIEPELGNFDRLARLKGSRAFLLVISEERFLVNVDNALILVEENNLQKTVLRAGRAGNFFWHATEAEGRVFVQEYGQPPTSIYASEDLQNWRRVVTNVDLDKDSRHFHYITWDPYRKWLIVTLGDGCLTRVAYSEDLGLTWRPLYRGAWQFVPIVPLENEVVFGMDSGIVSGGIGIYHSLRGKWEFVFLKWCGRSAKLAQMVDLKRLKSGVWIAALGVPQAIVMSRDLRTWYPLHLESPGVEFHMKVVESGEGNAVICSTGNSLVLFDENELESPFYARPAMVNYGALIGRLRGLAFVLKREIHAM